MRIALPSPERAGVAPPLLALAAALALAACGPTAPPATASGAPLKGPPVPQELSAGLDRVIGHDARSLEELFGEPNQDVREENARKLQFASSVCVLDAYLYPKPGSREPVVTWIDARLPSGDDIDRASCIAALSRRREAR